MKTAIKYFLLSLGIMTMISAVVVPADVQAASPAPAKTCNTSLLGIPAWYRGLTDGSCNIAIPKKNGNVDVQTFIMTLALNIIQAGLVLVAYVTIFFIIKGGFGYILSAGDSTQMASAKKTITNALIGLVIAVFSASIVNAIAGFIQ